MPDDDASPGVRMMDSFSDFMRGMVVAPARMVRENLVEPFRGESYPWYHRRFV